MGGCTPCGTSSKKYQEKPKAYSKYTQLEIYHLQLMYNDLTCRSLGKGILRQHFDAFFRLSGLWGDQMFRKFDKSCEGFITFDQFLQSIEIMIKGTFDEKANILFDFYDIEKTNGISLSQLLKMIYSYPKQQINRMITDPKFLATIDTHQLNYYFDPHKKINDRNIIDETEDYQGSERMNSNFNPSPEQLIQFQNKFNSSFNNKTNINGTETPQKQKIKNLTFNATNSNDYELKSMLIKPKKIDQNEKKARKCSYAVSNVFGGQKRKIKKKVTIRSNIASLVKKYAAYIFKEFKVDKKDGQLNRNQFKLLLKNNPEIFNSFFQGFHTYIWQQNDQHILQYKSITPWVQNFAQEVYKQIKQTRYLIFIQTTIFIFEQKSSLKPIQIKNLQGLQIRKIDQENVFGISFFHREGIYPQKKYFFQSKQILQEWLRQLDDFLTQDVYDEYQTVQRIGAGNFSIVYKGTEKLTGKQVAIKVIDKFKLTEQEKQVIKQQCGVLQLCHHPNIVKFIKQFNTKSHLYLVSQYLGEGDLFEYVKKRSFLDEYQAAIVFKQLCQAIKYLNELGLIHRDLKPENIMIITNKEKNLINKVKIIDFGFAIYKKALQNLSADEKYAGTPGFVAPQILQGLDFDQSVDTFSLGIILYFMLSGYLPFYSSVYEEIVQQTKDCNISLRNAHWANVSEDAKNLIESILTFKQSRIKLSDVMNHPWLSNMQILKQFNGMNKRTTKRQSIY